MRGAAKRTRDEAVVEDIRIVHRLASIATIRSEDFRPARAAGPLGTMLATSAPWASAARGTGPARMAIIRRVRPGCYDARHPPIRYPSVAANLHQ